MRAIWICAVLLGCEPQPTSTAEAAPKRVTIDYQGSLTSFGGGQIWVVTDTATAREFLVLRDSGGPACIVVVPLKP